MPVEVGMKAPAFVLLDAVEGERHSLEEALQRGPVVLAISTNEALGANAKNLGLLLNTKHVYMVPFGQDNPHAKPTSMVADFERIVSTVAWALRGVQIQPMIIERSRRPVR